MWLNVCPFIPFRNAILIRQWHFISLRPCFGQTLIKAAASNRPTIFVCCCRQPSTTPGWQKWRFLTVLLLFKEKKEDLEVQAGLKKKRGTKKNPGGHHLPPELNHPPASPSFELIIYSDIFEHSELHQGELLFFPHLEQPQQQHKEKKNNKIKNVPSCATTRSLDKAEVCCCYLGARPDTLHSQTLPCTFCQGCGGK